MSDECVDGGLIDAVDLVVVLDEDSFGCSIEDQCFFLSLRRCLVRVRLLSDRGETGSGDSLAFVQEGSDGIDIIDAAAPDSSAGLHECGPEAGVVGQGWVRGEVGARRALRELAGAFFGGEGFCCVADEVDRSCEVGAIDDDFDLIVLLQAAEGAPGEGFGGGVRCRLRWRRR